MERARQDLGAPKDLVRRARDLALKRGRRSKESVREAVRLLRAAAKAGDAAANYALGNWHIHGIGVRKDRRRAADYFSRAAKKGLRDASYDLALCYEAGSASAESEESISPLRQSCATWRFGRGLRTCALLLLRYRYHGFRRDPGKASSWYERAANSGDKRAQETLRQLKRFPAGRNPSAEEG